MKVKELIARLQEFDGELDVAYAKYSEYCLLDAEDIVQGKLQPPRADGWVHDDFGHRELRTHDYVLFPGN